VRNLLSIVPRSRCLLFRAACRHFPIHSGQGWLARDGGVLHNALCRCCHPQHAEAVLIPEPRSRRLSRLIRCLRRCPDVTPNNLREPRLLPKPSARPTRRSDTKGNRSPVTRRSLRRALLDTRYPLIGTRSEARSWASCTAQIQSIWSAVRPDDDEAGGSAFT
jgi:hypothetical protein